MVKMACERELWTFIWVLAVVRERAPSFKHCIICKGEERLDFTTFKQAPPRPLSELKPTVAKVVEEDFPSYRFVTGTFELNFSV